MSIGQRIRAGAAEIALAFLRITWHRTTTWLREKWIAFCQAAGETWHGLAHVFQVGMAHIAHWWRTLVTGMEDIWTRSSSRIRRDFGTVSADIARWMARAYARMAGHGEEALAQIDQWHGERIDELWGGHAAAMAQANRDLANRLAASERTRDEFIAELEDKTGKAVRDLAKASREELAKLQQQLDEAKTAFDKLIRGRKAPKPQKGEAPPEPDDYADAVSLAIKGAMAGQARAEAVRLAYEHPRLAARQAPGRDRMQQTAEDMRELLADIEINTRVQPAFTGD